MFVNTSAELLTSGLLYSMHILPVNTDHTQTEKFCISQLTALLIEPLVLSGQGTMGGLNTAQCLSESPFG